MSECYPITPFCSRNWGLSISSRFFMSRMAITMLNMTKRRKENRKYLLYVYIVDSLDSQMNGCVCIISIILFASTTWWVATYHNRCVQNQLLAQLGFE